MKPPLFWTKSRSWQATLLSPAAALYRALDDRARAFTKGQRFDKPVLCVGNVVAGGAGKTPCCLMLGKLLMEAGKKIAFVSRGYGGRCAGPLQVNGATHTHHDVGDEPLLLAELAPCWVAKNKVHGIQAAIAAGAEIVILDDGLQNKHIITDFSVLVLDGPYGIGNGCTLPAGPLREPWTHAANRAEVAIVIGTDRFNLTDKLALLAPELPVVTAQLVPDWPEDDIQTGTYVAFAGIGRPEKFFETCRTFGLPLIRSISFPDHHSYSGADWAKLQAVADSHGAKLITTEKDAVRLQSEWRGLVSVLPVTLSINEQDRLKNCLKPFLSPAA